MKISDHIDVLTIVGENGTIYPALLHDGKELMLIDAALPLQIELIRNAATDAGFSLSDVTAIVLTHQDLDHIGCVKEIKELSSNLVVMAHELEAPYIDGRLTPVMLALMEANFDALPPERKAFYPHFKQGFMNRRIKIDKELKTGDVLPVCGGIKVLHTPGHKPGHICLYAPKSRTLIAGDALNIRDGKLAGPNPKHTPDMQTAMESLRQLMEYDIRVCVAYHGGVLEGDVNAQLAKLLAGWER